MNSERRAVTSTSPQSLLAADDVLADLIRWNGGGLRTALVSMVAIDGATPRPLGAQMAVAENGLASGYLSGGCIEQSVAEEARRAMTDGKNRLVRYGRGSPYFDIQLPCGSGLDLYIDQSVPRDVIAAMNRNRCARQPFVHVTDIRTGDSTVEPYDGSQVTHLADSRFRRVHRPLPRVVLIGGGPALTAIAQLVSATGFELDILTPDRAALSELEQRGLSCRSLTDPRAINLLGLDSWTAAIVAFHEHDWEAPVLEEILRRPCFYVGAMGGKAAHANRLAQLAERGVPPEAQRRIRSPIGLIPAAKSRASLAVGILADVVAEAKSAGMIS